MPPRRHAYEFNRRTGRYYDRTSGRFVSQADVRRAIDRGLDNAARRAADVTNALRERRIGSREWAREMRGVVRDVQLYSAAAAKGGWARLTRSDLGRVGARVREQLSFLNRMAAQIRAGLPLDGRVMARAKLYAQAGRRLFHEVPSDDMRARGFLYERSVLTPADHCGECVAEAARGFVPIGTMRPIGTRECGPICRCLHQFAKDADGRAAA